MQNKKITHAIKKNDKVQRPIFKKEKNIAKTDNHSTPFELYILNKTLGEKSQRVGISSKVYDL